MHSTSVLVSQHQIKKSNRLKRRKKLFFAFRNRMERKEHEWTKWFCYYPRSIQRHISVYLFVWSKFTARSNEINPSKAKKCDQWHTYICAIPFACVLLFLFGFCCWLFSSAVYLYKYQTHWRRIFGTHKQRMRWVFNDCAKRKFLAISSNSNFVVSFSIFSLPRLFSRMLSKFPNNSMFKLEGKNELNMVLFLSLIAPAPQYVERFAWQHFTFALISSSFVWRLVHRFYSFFFSWSLVFTTVAFYVFCSLCVCLYVLHK